MRAAKRPLLLAALIVMEAITAGEEPPRSLNLPVPAGVDIDAQTWERLTAGFDKEKRNFVELLLTLDANRIDFTLDSLTDIQRKRHAITQALAGNTAAVLAAFGEIELEVDYARVSWDAVPRLTGRTLRVGPNEEVASLDAAWKQLQSGDTLQLASGSYNLLWPNNWQPPSDVVVAGSAADTSLNVEGALRQFKVERWRFANLGFAFGGREARSDMGLPGGTLHFQNCRFESIANPFGVMPSGGVHLLEGCLFSTSGGRSSGRIYMPSAEPHVVYFRSCKFVEMRELASFGASVAVYDQCESQVSRNSMIMMNMNRTLMRNSPTLVDRRMVPNGAPDNFRHDTDDVLSVLYVAGEPAVVEPRMRNLATRLQLSRSPTYWLSLLRHPDVTIRLRAADRLQALLGVEVHALRSTVVADAATEQLAQEIGDAIRELDSNEFATRAAARDRLLKLGTRSVDALRRLQQIGTPEQRRSAEVLLEKVLGANTMSTVPPAWEADYGRLSRWYSEHRNELVWQGALGQYRLASSTPSPAPEP